MWASYHTCSIIIDVNPWFSEFGWKLYLFCDNHVIKTDWKNNKKIHVFEVLIFWKCTVTVILKKFSSNTIFIWYTSEKFYIVQFTSFSERPNKVKERF